MISSYGQQFVSHIAHCVKGASSHLFLCSIGSEWYCTFCKRQSHHIFSSGQLQKVSDIEHFMNSHDSSHLSYDQQEASDIGHFVKGSLITSCPMTNSKWVTLYIWWQVVSSHLSIWPTASEWYCTFCERKSHHTFSILWPTASEWHWTFCERQSHHIFSYDQQQVSDIAHSVKGILVISSPMTKRKWVTMHILWKVVSWHLHLWPTASEWHCTFCERQSHHIFFYGQQVVSDIALCTKLSSHLCLWTTVCEWHCTFYEKQSNHIFFNDQ